MKLLISAGEASGERYGAQLIQALRHREPALDVMGVGGERMRSAGCRTEVDARDIAVVGLGEVITRLPRIWREFRRLVRAVDRERPAAAVLIDFPDWNFRLARELHRRGIPVIYYVSPQLWAWRPGRIELVRRYVRKMLVIFPFEEAWYRERGVEAEYVGHPLADLGPPQGPFALLTPSPVPAERIIALLPGSRRKEVAMNLPIMLQAAAALPGASHYVVPVASTISGDNVDRALRRTRVPVTSFPDARKALAMSRAAVVASGTAT